MYLRTNFITTTYHLCLLIHPEHDTCVVHTNYTSLSTQHGYDQVFSPYAPCLHVSRHLHPHLSLWRHRTFILLSSSPRWPSRPLWRGATSPELTHASTIFYFFSVVFGDRKQRENDVSKSFACCIETPSSGASRRSLCTEDAILNMVRCIFKTEDYLLSRSKNQIDLE